MVSGLTRNQVPRKGLRVRLPCPPLFESDFQSWSGRMVPKPKPYERPKPKPYTPKKPAPYQPPKKPEYGAK